MRGNMVWCILLGALVLPLGAGRAFAYEPLPWDRLDSFSEVDLPTRVYPRVRSRDRDMRRESFGTLGMLLDYGGFSGSGITDVGPGTGYTIEIPATLPGWLFYGLLMGATGLAAAPGGQDAWSSGFRGGGIRTSPVFDEMNVDFLYSKSRHSDDLFGGDLELTRLGLGIRLSGPAPIDRRLRGNLGFGWVRHDYRFEARDNLEAMGPYLLLGAESRVRNLRDDGQTNMYGVRLFGRWDWVRGVDFTGRFDTTLFSAGAGFSFYW